TRRPALWKRERQLGDRASTWRPPVGIRCVHLSCNRTLPARIRATPVLPADFQRLTTHGSFGAMTRTLSCHSSRTVYLYFPAGARSTHENALPLAATAHVNRASSNVMPSRGKNTLSNGAVRGIRHVSVAGPALAVMPATSMSRASDSQPNAVHATPTSMLQCPPAAQATGAMPLPGAEGSSFTGKSMQPPAESSATSAADAKTFRIFPPRGPAARGGPRGGAPWRTGGPV